MTLDVWIVQNVLGDTAIVLTMAVALAFILYAAIWKR